MSYDLRCDKNRHRVIVRLSLTAEEDAFLAEDMQRLGIVHEATYMRFLFNRYRKEVLANRVF